MTGFWILIGVAAVAAVVDWVAVVRDDVRVEYGAKPAVLAALTVAAAVLPADHTDLLHRKWWFVAALACSLLGDVLLMLPNDLFVPGLSAFLAGHVLFIIGLLQPPSPPGTPPFTFSALAVGGTRSLALEIMTGIFDSQWLSSPLAQGVTPD